MLSCHHCSVKLKLPYIMMYLILCIVLACNTTSTHTPRTPTKPNAQGYVGKSTASTIANIPLPNGYTRVTANGFGAYLRSVSLKKNNIVYLYNGTPKANQNAQYAVLDVSVSNRDLQQCADAVMRLRAEYLYSINLFNDILFIDNDRKPYQFTQPYTRSHFDTYLLKVFGMCGSASLALQLNHKPNISNMVIGDVLIRGGFPGHACLVVDMAVNDNGDSIFMLAQSYMPAQDIHILLNPLHNNTSPWYSIADVTDRITTPEYTFSSNELRSW